MDEIAMYVNVKDYGNIVCTKSWTVLCRIMDQCLDNFQVCPFKLDRYISSHPFLI